MRSAFVIAILYASPYRRMYTGKSHRAKKSNKTQNNQRASTRRTYRQNDTTQLYRNFTDIGQMLRFCEGRGGGAFVITRKWRLLYWYNRYRKIDASKKMSQPSMLASRRVMSVCVCVNQTIQAECPYTLNLSLPPSRSLSLPLS